MSKVSQLKANHDYLEAKPMIKYLSRLLFLLVIGYLAWPYFHLYQLHRAVINNDSAAIKKLVDLEKVNQVFKDNLKWQMNHTVNTSSSLFPEAVKQGAQTLMGTLGNLAAEAVVIDAQSLLDRLHKINGSLWEKTTFAFFESPTRFTIRLGQLGRNPIHIQMTLQDWSWRVTAIYD